MPLVLNPFKDNTKIEQLCFHSDSVQAWIRCHSLVSCCCLQDCRHDQPGDWNPWGQKDSLFKPDILVFSPSEPGHLSVPSLIAVPEGPELTGLPETRDLSAKTKSLPKSLSRWEFSKNIVHTCGWCYVILVDVSHLKWLLRQIPTYPDVANK